MLRRVMVMMRSLYVLRSAVTYMMSIILFFLLTTAFNSAAHPASCPIGTECKKLTVNLHLLPKLRIHGSMPPLPNISSWYNA
jgi:hypothetical protein